MYLADCCEKIGLHLLVKYRLSRWAVVLFIIALLVPELYGQRGNLMHYSWDFEWSRPVRRL